MTLISSISGIRGTVNGTNQTSLTPIDVVRYVSAYGTWINTKKKSSTVVVGRDGRISGKSLLELVKSTLISLGINVIDTGLSTTPTTQIIIKEKNADGGILTKEDFLLYKPVWRQPFIFEFDDLKIITMGLPSSGGIVLSQILKSIELISLDNYKTRDINYIKTLIELEKISFADRSRFLGDPEFYDTKIINSLVSTDYLNKRIKSIDFSNPKPSSEIYPGNISFKESNETTHYSILDSFGNAVSVTTTLNSNFGSKIVIPSLGFFMNNEMDDFSIKTGSPNIYGLIGGKVNSIQPQKRMLSSMTPTIIEKDGKLSMILGSPGGPTIITSVLQTILNVYLFNDNLKEAVDHPRFHHLWLPDKIYFEEGAFKQTIIDSLKIIGYNFNSKTSSIGRVDAIYIDQNKKIYAAADPRGDDYASGE